MWVYMDEICKFNLKKVFFVFFLCFFGLFYVF